MARAQEAEVGPGGQRQGGAVHDIFVGNVAIGQDHLIGLVAANQFRELFFGVDGDALGIERAGQDGGVEAAFDIGNLGGGEGHDFVLRAVAVVGVEVVKVAAGRSHDDDPFSFHPNLL